MHHVEQEQMTELLFQEDPMGLARYGQETEYALEAKMVLARIGQCKNVGEIQQVIHSVFSTTFHPVTAGHVADYYDTAVALWVDRLGLDKEPLQ